MSQYPHHQRLSLKNFTAFHDVEFEFVPGVNVFVGENGTGKTHAMKALYGIQFGEWRNDAPPFLGLFQIKAFPDIIRAGADRANIEGSYSEQPLAHTIYAPTDNGASDAHIVETIGRLTRAGWVSSHGEWKGKLERPVFIPAIDMMGHSRGFTEAYEEVRLDFDITCRDIRPLA